MPTAAEILADLSANMAQPKRARTEAGEVEQHELEQQVAAAKFVMNAQASASSPFSCLRFARIQPPGAGG